MLTVKRISGGDDLALLVRQINDAEWDDANEMVAYGVAALAAYLQREDTVFVACYCLENGVDTLLGIASGRFELKPYDGERWLYVDEVDVATDQRRRGAGRALMEKLIELAGASGCQEVWLPTDSTGRSTRTRSL